MLASGIAVCLGVLIIFWKCSWKIRMWILSHPIFVDISVFTLLTLIHWGTFTGVMAATIGALMISVILAAGKYAFGHTAKGKYMRGMWDISEKLK